MRPLVLLCAAALACGSDAPEPIAIEDAEEAVIAWFAAVGARDCEHLQQVTRPTLSEEACAGLLEDFEHHNARFDGIESSFIDRRASGVVVVKARVQYRKAATDEHRWLMRAERKDGAWLIHSPS